MTIYCPNPRLVAFLCGSFDSIHFSQYTQVVFFLSFETPTPICNRVRLALPHAKSERLAHVKFVEDACFSSTTSDCPKGEAFAKPAYICHQVSTWK